MTILDMAIQAGIRPKWVASTKGGEYHSECPVCGGRDRFYIQPHKQMKNCKGYFCCRQCGISGDTIKFAMEFLNLTFEQAIKELGVIIEKNYLSKIRLSNTLKPVVLIKPKDKWLHKAKNFVETTHTQLLKNQQILNYLNRRGISLSMIVKYKLGWSNMTNYYKRTDWGLEEQLNQNGQPKKLYIAGGIVIPSIDKSSQVTRLKIRRLDWHENDELPKYMVVSGSMNGLNILDGSKDIVIVVESELDAYVMHTILEQSATIIAVGGNTKNPDNVADRIANNAKRLLINHDNDIGGKAMLDKWQKLYPHAKPCPVPEGKDLSEAAAKGFDIKTWLHKIICN